MSTTKTNLSTRITVLSTPNFIVTTKHPGVCFITQPINGYIMTVKDYDKVNASVAEYKEKLQQQRQQKKEKKELENKHDKDKNSDVSDSEANRSDNSDDEDLDDTDTDENREKSNSDLL